MPKKLDPLVVETSRLRLLGLSLFAFLAFASCLVLLFAFADQGLAAGSEETSFAENENAPAWLFPGLLLLVFMFLAWGITALITALQLKNHAYRLDARGVYFGTEATPAFEWAQVKGATLARGKRRSSVVFVLDDPSQINRKGMLAPILATFLGRPTDRDIALTNMDTKLGLQAFLDLIAPYLATYGQAEIKQRNP